MIFGTCKLHETTSGVMQILCNFRSTPPYRPNKVGLKCPSVRMSVRPSVHKRFLRI